MRLVAVLSHCFPTVPCSVSSYLRFECPVTRPEQDYGYGSILRPHVILMIIPGTLLVMERSEREPVGVYGKFPELPVVYVRLSDFLLMAYFLSLRSCYKLVLPFVVITWSSAPLVCPNEIQSMFWLSKRNKKMK